MGKFTCRDCMFPLVPQIRKHHPWMPKIKGFNKINIREKPERRGGKKKGLSRETLKKSSEYV